MPIYKGTLKTGSAYKGGTSLSRIYKGIYLVFEAFKTLIAEGVPPLTLLNCAAEIMLGYRIYGDSRQGKLPAGYTQIEYIEATGTQYIDTGFSPDGNTKVDYKVETTAGEYDASPFIGARVGSTNTARFFPIAYNNTNGEGRTSFGSKTVVISNVVAGTVFEGSFDPINGISTINGTDYDISGASFQKTDNYNLYLFATTGYVDNLYLSHGKMYYCKIYNNGTLVRSYIPAKNSSNVVGMYDLVNGVFYQNAGTGTFTAGANAPTPNAPIEIESVGDKTKNLWNSTIVSGCYRFNNGDYIQYPGYVCNATPIPVEPGETYTLSAKDYDDPYGAGFVFYNNGVFVSSSETNNLTITVPAGANQLCYDFRKSSSPNSLDPSDITNVQLQKGGTATAYEPYGYKIPMTVNSKNLWDKASSYTGGTIGIIDSQSLDSTKTYTISFDVSANYQALGGSTYIFSLRYDGSGRINIFNTDLTAGQRFSKTFTGIDLVRFANQSSYSGTLSNIMIEEGSTPTSYAPYQMVTNIYLGEPLRKIGNADAAKLPSGYTQVEYIKSTGTQYINTGFTPNQDTKVEIDFIMDDYTGKAIYGSRVTADNSTFSAMLQGQNNNSSFQYNTSAVTNTIAYTNGQSYKVVQDKNKLYVDGTLEHTFTYANFTCPGSLYIFSVNQSGTTPFFGKISVKSFKIWDNGTLVRNFIPCTDSNNVLGLYDTVNDKFYSNQGTGTFTAGRVVYTDYIDFETQKVYRNVGSIDLGELTYTYQDNVSRFRSSTIPNLKIITGNWTYDLMCDIYGTNLAQNFNIGAQGGAAFIWDNRYTDHTALENAVKGHILDYALNTPTEETITLPDILLNKGTNIISVGTSLEPSDMWIKYKGK